MSFPHRKLNVSHDSKSVIQESLKTTFISKETTPRNLKDISSSNLKDISPRNLKDKLFMIPHKREDSEQNISNTKTNITQRYEPTFGIK